MKSETLIELASAAVSINGKTILSDITWSFDKGRNWLVRGHNGAGKSTFLKLASGKLWPAINGGKRFFGVNGRRTESPILFRQQARFASLEQLEWYRLNNWNISVFDVVCSGLFGTMLLHGKPEKSQKDKVEQIMDRLGLRNLCERGILTLSHGQAKRALLARALVSNPRVLFLDEIYDGLDAFWKQRFSDELLLAVENGTGLVWATNEDVTFPLITHAMELERGKIKHQGPLKSDPISTFCDFFGTATTRPASLKTPDDDFVIRIENSDVFIGGNKVLHQINWTVSPGENWTILGENGAGKTTLVKLIAGELSPAWGGGVFRFGKKDPMTLWEIRSRVSLVSTDLQTLYKCSQTGLELVLSGLFGSIGLHAGPTQRQVQAAEELLKDYGLQHLRNADTQHLSQGELKILLIMRALINDPDVMLVDEPTAGLDAKSVTELMSILGRVVAGGKTLICATHHPEMIKNLAPNVLELKNGRITDTSPASLTLQT